MGKMINLMKHRQGMKMENIVITPNISIDDYLVHSITWDKSENVLIDTSKLENIDDIVYCAKLALPMPDIKFSLAVLEQLSEIKIMPMNVLEEIILTGDPGCCESICMRTDLNSNLRRMCSCLELTHKKTEIISSSAHSNQVSFPT